MYSTLCTFALFFVVVQGRGSTTESSSALRGRHHVAGDETHQQTTGIQTFPLVPHRERYGAMSTYNEDNTDKEHRYPQHRAARRRLDRPPQPYTPLPPTNADETSAEETTPDIDPLYQGYGTHYVDLWIGTPPQRQTVIVDTGSSVTSFPCSDCGGCGTGYHTDTYFQESQSETFKEVGCEDCMLGKCFVGTSCDIGVSYQEGSSWRAFEAVDVVYSGGPHDAALDPVPDSSFQLHFGCQTHLTGLFKTQLADGIMGMEMMDMAFWKQMYSVGALHERSFSLCFSRQPMADKVGTQAGAMTLGGSDTRLHDTQMVYAAQLNDDNGWYVVKIKNIFLRTGGGDRVVVPDDVGEEDVQTVAVESSEAAMNNGNVILDSGTTDTYLTSKLEGPFKAAWKSLTGEDYNNNPRTMTEVEIERLPTVLLQLEVSRIDSDNTDSSVEGLVGDLDPENPRDVLVAMPPSHYLEYNINKGVYTSRLYLNENHGGVLGANFMMGHDVFFDMENNRVGFAESECDYGIVDNAEEESTE